MTPTATIVVPAVVLEPVVLDWCGHPPELLGEFGEPAENFFHREDLFCPVHTCTGAQPFRVHGHGSDKYDNVRLGLTARLDTIQAAVLIEKLKIFDDEIAASLAATMSRDHGRTIAGSTHQSRA